MNHKNFKQARKEGGWTLVELVMVLSLVSMLIVIILPQFRILQKSWDLKEARAEIQQHGRVLADHLHRELSSAKAVTAMSEPASALGYLEYLDAADQPRRYEVGSGNYVYFGSPGDLSLLAGPVSRFQVSGFAADDLASPTADAGQVRLVRIQSAIDSASVPGKTESFSFSACIRASSEPSEIRLLFVVSNPASLSAYEQRLYNRFVNWGYLITLIDDHASQAAYDAAAALADAGYIPASCGCQNLGSKLRLTPIGVVSEHLDCHDDMRFSNQEGSQVSDLQIRIYDNTHPLTTPYSINAFVTVLSSGDLNRMRGSAASGLQVLALRPAQGHTVMAVLETGSLLQGGQPAPGRRVILPWGNDAFDNSGLDEQGWSIIRRAVEWSAGAI
jgi:hypothetical protein